MRKLASAPRLALLAALAAFSLQATAAELTWHTDMAKALKTAQTEKKAVLVDFTGSDWCEFCIKLDNEVFATKEFAEFAAKNLVLVKADFPRKTKLAPELQKANEALRDQYAKPFQGYPTIVLVSAAGKKLGETVGYAPGSGPKAYIKELTNILKK